MAYADIDGLMTIATGQPLPAAVVQQINDNFDFLVDSPACSIKESTAQSIGTGSSTALTADEENFDNDSMHSTVSSTSRITFQTAGRYLLVAGVEFAANTTGHRAIFFKIDGTTSLSPAVSVQAVQTGSTTTGLVVARPYVATAAQYAEVFAFQNSGGNLNATLHEFSALFLTR